uniref:Uncharacterized protein LOC113793785 n=1 Tax=Dermatophagoides pteronyssinus TaxID=6956 RepID=A0A6P6Y2E0_DERPT|nr:uncharacterized protein LOC113793785 [Dermatophagoides pteronyssinus]
MATTSVNSPNVNNRSSHNTDTNDGEIITTLTKMQTTLDNAVKVSKNMRVDVKKSIDDQIELLKSNIIPQVKILISNVVQAQNKESAYRKRITELEISLQLKNQAESDKLENIEKMILENKEALTKISNQGSDTNKKTYAKAATINIGRQKAAPKNSYASILYLKDDEEKTKTSTDALQVARKLVCSKPAGTAIIANKLLSNGKIMIFSKDENSKANLDNLINASDEMISEEPKRQNPVILLKGVPKEIDRDDVPKIIKDCNQDIANACENEDSITVVYLKTNRKEHLVNVAIKVTPTIRRIILETLDRNVSFGFNLVYAEDASPVRQCFHCLSFGHTQTKCPVKEKNKEELPQCMHCPGKHLKANCPEKNKKVICCNCAKQPGTSNKQPENINHSPISEKCPIYKAVLTKAISKIDYGY